MRPLQSGEPRALWAWDGKLNAKGEKVYEDEITPGIFI